MTEKEFKKVRRFVLTRLLKDKEKEFYCHIQFVLKVGLELAQSYNADPKIIELSCLFHDIGRDQEIGEEDHGDSGARIAADLLANTKIPPDETNIILGSIRSHTKKLPKYTLEQKILITADNASKVLYHEAFMLLCKKQTYAEKLAWGIKYLEKGYKNTLFSEYKKQISHKYWDLKETYRAVSAAPRL